ncbi:MAG: hypothetical protein A2X46_09065 [Lentisphaerae bacterium GWF2_57_35]|nr:MAG: hypothetical protein A2X46_09065 [Lentisphaerae bacterium GWF2_57_35]
MMCVRFKRMLFLAGALVALASLPLQAQDDSPDTIYRNGIGRFSEGNYAESARLFQELLSKFGQEPALQTEMEGVYYALGCSLYNLGKYPEAVEVYRSYLTRFPTARYRDEAMFRIGTAQQAQEAYDAAIEAYRQLTDQMPNSPYAEDAAFQVGACCLLKTDYDKAAAAFGAFCTAYPASELTGQALLFMSRAYYEGGKLDKAVDALAVLEGRGRRLSNIVYANFLAFEIGDAAYDDTNYELALRAYRRVQTRESLLRLQRRLVGELQTALETFLTGRIDSQAVAERFRKERRLAGDLDQAQSLLQKLETIPDYDAGLFHRIGRCFFNTDRYWEACVAFTRVVKEARDEALREAAHFDLIMVLSRMRRFEDLIGESDRYLARYEQGNL